MTILMEVHPACFGRHPKYRRASGQRFEGCFSRTHFKTGTVALAGAEVAGKHRVRREPVPVLKCVLSVRLEVAHFATRTDRNTEKHRNPSQPEA
jgi:hypothetical protein